MELFKNIILFIVSVSLIITAVQIYLQINKIWKRKHEREVAASQSISGLVLLIFNCIVSILYYAVNEDDWISVADTSLYLFQAILLTLISTGIFVRDRERLNFWQLVKTAFRMERREADYLIKKFFKPNNAAMIIDILHQLAMIDEVLDPKEEELIQAFSKEWNINYDVSEFNKARHESAENNYIRLRDSVEEYLSSAPPTEQAAQLKDMMQTLIEADDEISKEEELISSELIGVIENYISDDENSSRYDVLIVPQNMEQHTLVTKMAPKAKRFNVAGGEAYSMGTYYSHKYAEMICNQYRDINLFTIVHSSDEVTPSQQGAKQ
jgi:hypothetical protein